MDQPPTKEWFEKNNHISDADVAKDIADTEREIDSCRKVSEAYRTLAVHDFTRPNQQAMHSMRADQAHTDIAKGQRLLESLQLLQQWRANGRP